MTPPDCQRHQDLVQRLARGELALHEADRAEEVRRQCPVCAAWWSRQFESWRARQVARGAKAGLAAFRPPRSFRARARRASLAAAAAAVVIAAGTGLLLRGDLERRPHRVQVEAAAAGAGRSPVSGSELVSRMDFEVEESRQIFVDGFESGDLGPWRGDRAPGTLTR